jgi:hypothetical protein
MLFVNNSRTAAAWVGFGNVQRPKCKQIAPCKGSALNMYACPAFSQQTPSAPAAAQQQQLHVHTSVEQHAGTVFAYNKNAEPTAARHPTYIANFK